MVLVWNACHPALDIELEDMQAHRRSGGDHLVQGEPEAFDSRYQAVVDPNLEVIRVCYADSSRIPDRAGKEAAR